MLCRVGCFTRYVNDAKLTILLGLSKTKPTAFSFLPLFHLVSIGAQIVLREYSQNTKTKKKSKFHRLFSTNICIIQKFVLTSPVIKCSQLWNLQSKAQFLGMRNPVCLIYWSTSHGEKSPADISVSQAHGFITNLMASKETARREVSPQPRNNS